MADAVFGDLAREAVAGAHPDIAPCLIGRGPRGDVGHLRREPVSPACRHAYGRRGQGTPQRRPGSPDEGHRAGPARARPGRMKHSWAPDQDVEWMTATGRPSRGPVVHRVRMATLVEDVAAKAPARQEEPGSGAAAA